MSAFTPVDLSLLPAPEVIETLDFEVIFERLREQLIAAAPELVEALALESEPAVKVLQIVAYSELTLRARINDAAKAVLLAYATGGDLDNLAALLGVSRSTGEDDARFRERTRLALQAYSSAGPAGAWRYHAFSADPRILDVHADSVTPGEVRLVVMSAEGDGIPDAAMLEAVTAAVTAEDVRVLTVQVAVQAAVAVDFTVDAELSVTGVTATVALAQASAALDAYLARRRGLGLRVTRSGLIAALHVEGVEAVTLTAPAADIEPAVTAFARCTAISVQEAAP